MASILPQWLSKQLPSRLQSKADSNESSAGLSEEPPIKLVTPLAPFDPVNQARWYPRLRRKLISIVKGSPTLSHTGRVTNAVRTSKYTIYNFIPICGIHQFYHLSNVYFVVIYVFALLGEVTSLFDSPISSVGFLLSLALVVSLTMIFEGYYDIKRHREDDRVNSLFANRMREGDGFIEQVRWEQIVPGDVLKVANRKQIPADMILLTTSTAEHKCYVETSNIDGETNLKVRRIPHELVEHTAMPEEASSLAAEFTYDAPSAFLTFTGNARLLAHGDKMISLSTEHLLLRGSVLRNTPWVIGVVVYAGLETKAFQSSKNPPVKKSRMMRLVDKIILVLLFVMFGMCVASAIAVLYAQEESEMWYLAGPVTFQARGGDIKTVPPFLANMLTFMILYSNLVPIALLISVTLCNTIQAMLINWDVEMYYEPTDTSAKCRTLELVQELGQVSYVFSDKTGTLTRNEMKLVGCSVGGKTYGIGNHLHTKPNKIGGLGGGQLLCDVAKKPESGEDVPTSENTIPEIFSHLIEELRTCGENIHNIEVFLTIIAVCNTVLVDRSEEVSAYNAEGPDEEALVSAVAELGFKLLSTDNGVYEVEISVPKPAFLKEEVEPVVPETLEEGEQFDDDAETILGSDSDMERDAGWEQISDGDIGSNGEEEEEEEEVEELAMDENGNVLVRSDSPMASPSLEEATGEEKKTKKKNGHQRNLTYTDEAELAADQLREMTVDSQEEEETEWEGDVVDDNDADDVEDRPVAAQGLSLGIVPQEKEEEEDIGVGVDVDVDVAGAHIKKDRGMRDKKDSSSISDEYDEIEPVTIKFQVLAINHFNSTRKRMSCVIRLPNGQLVLCVKGADSVIFERMAEDQRNSHETKVLEDHLTSFAKDGLRTLVIAKRDISMEEYRAWKVSYDKALTALGGKREEQLIEVAEAIETNLEIAGATAIEDRLQDHVPETLQTIKDAGVKVWVLTGDKVETAINIAFSAELLDPNMHLVKLTSADPDVNLHAIDEMNKLLTPENLDPNSKLRCDIRDRKKGSSLSDKDLTKGGINDMDPYAMLGALKNKVSGRLSKRSFSGTSLSPRGGSSPNKQDIPNGYLGEDGGISPGFNSSPRRRKESRGRRSSMRFIPGYDRWVHASERRAQRKVDKANGAANIVSNDKKNDTQHASSVSVPPQSALKGARAATAAQVLVKPKAGVGGEGEAGRPVRLMKQLSLVTEDDAAEAAAADVDVEAAMSAGAANTAASIAAVTAVAPNKTTRLGSNTNAKSYAGMDPSLDSFEAENLAMVVSGQALESLLAAERGTPETQQKLLRMARICGVVLACRVSPKQKALLVKMVKNGVRIHGQEPVTLAIGDGANDVAMIQAARVGVGIAGNEGAQAVNSADFAIGQFRFLSRLMIIHGRWNYRRMSAVVLYIFYSNVMFVFSQFFYNFYNNFSGASMYFVFLLVLYSYPTNFPSLCIGAFNKDITAETVLSYPALYVSGRANLDLGSWKIAEYVVRSLVHAIIICGISLAAVAPKDVTLDVLGTGIYFNFIMVALCQCCLEFYTWNKYTFMAVVVCFVLFLIAEPIYYNSAPDIYTLYGGTSMWAPNMIPAFIWRTSILSTACCVCFGVMIKWLRRLYFPNIVDVMMEIDRRGGTPGSRAADLEMAGQTAARLTRFQTIDARAVSDVIGASSQTEFVPYYRSAFDFDAPPTSFVNNYSESNVVPESPEEEEEAGDETSDSHVSGVKQLMKALVPAFKFGGVLSRKSRKSGSSDESHASGTGIGGPAGAGAGAGASASAGAGAGTAGTAGAGSGGIVDHDSALGRISRRLSQLRSPATKAPPRRFADNSAGTATVADDGNADGNADGANVGANGANVGAVPVADVALPETLPPVIVFEGIETHIGPGVANVTLAVKEEEGGGEEAEIGRGGEGEKGEEVVSQAPVKQGGVSGDVINAKES